MELAEAVLHVCAQKKRFERSEQSFLSFSKLTFSPQFRCKLTPKTVQEFFRGAAVFTCFARRQISWNAAFSLGFIFAGQRSKLSEATMVNRTGLGVLKKKERERK